MHPDDVRPHSHTHSGHPFVAHDNEQRVRYPRRCQILPPDTNNAHRQINVGLNGSVAHGVNIPTNISQHLIQSHGTVASLGRHPINSTLAATANAATTNGRSVVTDPDTGQLLTQRSSPINRTLFQGPHPTPVQNVYIVD